MLFPGTGEGNRRVYTYSHRDKHIPAPPDSGLLNRLGGRFRPIQQNPEIVDKTEACFVSCSQQSRYRGLNG